MSTYISDPRQQTDASLSGQQQALARELANRRIEFAGAINDLKRIAAQSGHGNRAANRASYQRVYALIERLAQMVADASGEDVTYPPFDPPGENAVSNTELAARIDRLAAVLSELTGKNVLAPTAPRVAKPQGV